MKKFFILLLALVLFAPSALADTDKEIVFHGIPWEISVNELVDQLKERKIPISSSDILANQNMRLWGSQFTSIGESYINSAGYAIMFWDYDDRIKIAGYPVRNIDIFSHYGIIDGKISFDANDSEYYLCTIMFAANDEMAISIYHDLMSKLNTLYKTGTESASKYGSTAYTYTVWNGANNTAVCLYRSTSTSSDYQFVYLMYGKTNSEQTLREVRRLVIEHEIQSVADDTTGL